MITSKDCYVRKFCKKDCDINNDEFCIRLFKLDNLYNNSLLSYAQRQHLNLYTDLNGTDLDKFKELEEISNNIESFVNNGNNLFIYSSTCGNGKTSWAIRLMQSYFNKIWFKCDLGTRALFINVPKFLIELKNSISKNNDYINHIKDNILTAELVIWDDIATKTSTEYEMEQLLNFIDFRNSNRKSNIYTSNINPNSLDNLVGARLASRIIGNTVVKEFNGCDKRSFRDK